MVFTSSSNVSLKYFSKIFTDDVYTLLQMQTMLGVTYTHTPQNTLNCYQCDMRFKIADKKANNNRSDNQFNAYKQKQHTHTHIHSHI